MTSATTATTVTTHMTPFVRLCIQYASITIIYYDHILTFPMEVRYFWGKKFRLSSFFYILCRYSLVANVLYVLAISNKLQPGCDIWYKVIGVMSVMGRAAVIATFTTRTYALYSGSRPVLIYLSVIGFICIALDVAHVPGLRCVGSSKVPILDTLLSIFMVVFEYSSAILMTIRCIQAFRIGGEWATQPGGFIFMIFKQGILYFAVVSIFTTAAVVLNFCAKAGFWQRLLNALTLPLSCLLTARFILHLRRWEEDRIIVASGKANGTGSQSATLPVFQVDTKSTVVDEFGEDPVVAAKNWDSRRDSDALYYVESIVSDFDVAEDKYPRAGSSREGVDV